MLVELTLIKLIIYSSTKNILQNIPIKLEKMDYRNIFNQCTNSQPFFPYLTRIISPYLWCHYHDIPYYIILSFIVHIDLSYCTYQSWTFICFKMYISHIQTKKLYYATVMGIILLLLYRICHFYRYNTYY